MRDNWKLSAIRASMGTEASKGYLTSDANKTAMLAKVETIIQNAIAVGCTSWWIGTPRKPWISKRIPSRSSRHSRRSMEITQT